jgi:hypothetical protein
MRPGPCLPSLGVLAIVAGCTSAPSQVRVATEVVIESRLSRPGLARFPDPDPSALLEKNGYRKGLEQCLVESGAKDASDEGVWVDRAPETIVNIRCGTYKARWVIYGSYISSIQFWPVDNLVVGNGAALGDAVDLTVGHDFAVRATKTPFNAGCVEGEWRWYTSNPAVAFVQSGDSSTVVLVGAGPGVASVVAGCGDAFRQISVNVRVAGEVAP